LGVSPAAASSRSALRKSAETLARPPLRIGINPPPSCSPMPRPYNEREACERELREELPAQLAGYQQELAAGRACPQVPIKF
jgi:hypothetical protein